MTKIRKIGPVKFVVAPDVGHWMNLRELASITVDFKAVIHTLIKFPENFSQAFPDAKVIGVEGLEAKVPGVKFDGRKSGDKILYYLTSC